MTIISLDDHRPHMAGPVVCARCLHTWISVRPAGELDLECPACGAMAGADLQALLATPEALLGDECCGQVDSAGTCCTPACIRGTALRAIAAIKIAYQMEHGQ